MIRSIPALARSLVGKKRRQEERKRSADVRSNVYDRVKDVDCLRLTAATQAHASVTLVRT